MVLVVALGASVTALTGAQGPRTSEKITQFACLAHDPQGSVRRADFDRLELSAIAAPRKIRETIMPA